MAKAGQCAQCGTNVWLTEEGGCPNGHDASQISNVYETEPAKDQVAETAEQVGEALTDAGKEAAKIGKQGLDWLSKQVNKPSEGSGGGGGGGMD